ncbi:MAG: NDP-sugar synthase [Candidatus Brockarchaeota archaeon]|nr:NDP-sugar synthase [Candidatus Brockarchaeota archaeon]
MPSRSEYPKTAVVLCGGLGERLRPITERIPKAMIPVRNRPIAEWQVRWLLKFGVDNVIFACGHLYEKIAEYFGRSDLKAKFHYSVEKEKVGTSGAVKQAFSMVGGNATYVLNGDVLCALNLYELADFHFAMGKLGTIAVTQLRSPYGICESFNGVLERFVEKPLLPHWMNSGIYVFNKGIVPSLVDKGDLERDVFPKLAGLLAVYMTRSRWMTVDTAKDLKESETQIKDYEDWLEQPI